MLICIFNKNLKQPFLDAPPLFNAFLIRKLRGEVFDGDGAFSAGNNMRVTVVSEGSDNNSYHLQGYYILFLKNLSYAKQASRHVSARLFIVTSEFVAKSVPLHGHQLYDRGRFSFNALCGALCCLHGGAW